MKHRYDVIIAGAGMVGSALACALADHGYSIALIDPGEIKSFDIEQSYDLRVSALSLASQRLLEDLGAWKFIIKNRVSPYTDMQVWNEGGNGSVEFHAMEYAEVALGYIVENKLVQWSLLQACKERTGIDVINDSISSFVAADQDVVVTLADQSVLICSLLAGADGAHSKVREAASFALEQRDYQQSAIVANVNCTQLNEQTAYQRFLENGILAFLPLSDGSSSIVWSAEESHAQHLMSLDNREFSAAVGAALEFKLGEVTSCSKRAIFPLVGRHASHYVKQGVVLVGDAAHTVHPLAGQGVNLGFQDIKVLADVLKQKNRNPGSYHLLRKYERQRRGENELMLRSMEGFKMLFNTSNPLLSIPGNIGLDLVNKIKPLKSMFVNAALGKYN